MNQLPLTQKETMLLKDALSHEQICVVKYNNYANQMQDTELSSMFKTLASREQQHIDTINRLLQQS
ncbi:ferritin-like domain-containing protein [Tepidanaerobacter sp. EBM-38]|uniref:ferritin-like domain-containing protein n=1 Tax=Tepidanaerobacter sp. EBM-38 TaxID=1918496 RepID=UPI0025EA0B17|nr:ferritin-like domain-containing protein [Tepidanaerobacter sp. EBM-38]